MLRVIRNILRASSKLSNKWRVDTSMTSTSHMVRIRRGSYGKEMYTSTYVELNRVIHRLTCEYGTKYYIVTLHPVIDPKLIMRLTSDSYTSESTVRYLVYPDQDMSSPKVTMCRGRVMEIFGCIPKNIYVS